MLDKIKFWCWWLRMHARPYHIRYILWRAWWTWFDGPDKVRNACTCGICQSPADLINRSIYVCQANSSHIGDICVGIFSNCDEEEYLSNKVCKGRS